MNAKKSAKQVTKKSSTRQTSPQKPKPTVSAQQSSADSKPVANESTKQAVKQDKVNTHASFMRLALAWQYQAGARKGRSPILPGIGVGISPRIQNDLRPGTRLVREWRGTTYHVLITESGFDYAGKSYRSLSAIARIITGTAWSGPAFFGIGR